MKNDLIKAIASGDVRVLKGAINHNWQSALPFKQYQFIRVSEMGENEIKEVPADAVFKSQESGKFYSYDLLMNMFPGKDSIKVHIVGPHKGVKSIVVQTRLNIDSSLGK